MTNRRAWREQPHVVYRYFDADGALLYVGCSANYTQRRRSHELASPWWSLVEREEVDTFPDYEVAYAWEQHEIKTLAPAYNVLSSPDRKAAAERLAGLVEATA